MLKGEERGVWPWLYLSCGEIEREGGWAIGKKRWGGTYKGGARGWNKYMRGTTLHVMVVSVHTKAVNGVYTTVDPD